MSDDPLTETERQELERLREEVELRRNSSTLIKAQNLAGFIWGPSTIDFFGKDLTKLWAALPEETRQTILEFVMTPHKGPAR